MREARVEAVPAPKPRFLDHVREVIRSKHYSPRTEKAYVFWIRRFIVFSGRRHPDTMAEPEIARFLEALATRLRVSASTQNQAFSAILFLYRNVLGRELKGLCRGHLVRSCPSACPSFCRRPRSRQFSNA